MSATVPIIFGQFTYSTGDNIGDGKAGAPYHQSDVATMAPGDQQLMLQLPTDDTTLNEGDSIGFSFTNAEGDLVTVEDAVVQISGWAKDGDNMTGTVIARGTDQNGDDIVLWLNMNSTRTYQAGETFYDSNDDSTIAEKDRTDVELDLPVNMLYLGNHDDVDTDEHNFDAENAANLKGVARDWSNGLTLLQVQPHDARGSKHTDQISDDDFGSGDAPGDGGDRVSYIHPETGETVIAATDSSIVFEALLTVIGDDGKPTEIMQNVAVVQLDNGDVLVSELANDGSLDGLKVQRVELLDPVKADYGSWYDGQSADVRVVCFAAETLIDTAAGPVPADSLTRGMLVKTADDGLQPIRWIGHRRVGSKALAANPHLYPIRIRAGALGRGLPNRDLVVSPQHRILLRSPIAERMASGREVLVAAKHLLEVEGIEVATDLSEVTYVHFMFNNHQMVFAEGALSESLYIGPQALKAISQEARSEIFFLFQNHRERQLPAILQPARLMIPGRKARQLVSRHIRNRKPLVE